MSLEGYSAIRHKEPPNDSKRSQVLSACRRCRHQKKRCDGRRPACGNCSKSKRNCDYESVNVNENRAGAAKRRTAALQSQVNDIAESLHMLKSMSTENAIQWLSELRSARDPLRALQYLRFAATGAAPLPAQLSESLTNRNYLSSSQSTLDLVLAKDYPTIYPLPSFGERAFGARTTSAFSSEDPLRSPSRMPEGSAEVIEQLWYSPLVETSSRLKLELCDDRLSDLDIAYWTTVPIANNLAARILSVYFETDHPLLSPFDADLFIRDLTTKTLRFCSPLLVNSVLSWACQTYHDVIPDAAYFTTDFVTAAEKLFRAERNNASILNVAALLCLTLSSICSGNQANANDYLLNSLRMAVSLGLHGENATEIGDLGLFLPDWISAYSYVAWASYNFCCIHLFHYRATTLIDFICRPPLLPVPSAQISGVPDLSFNPQPLYIGQTFELYCRLLPLYQEILAVYLDENVCPAKTVPFAFVEEKYKKLLRWSELIPSSLARTWAMPHHAAILHASFHAMVMELFRPFLHKNLKLNIFTRPNTRVEEIFLSSSAQIVEINRLYHSKFHDRPPRCTITCFLVPIYTAHISLRGTADTREERQRDFKLCMQAFKGLGMTETVRESIVRGCMSMAITSGLLLPKESRCVLHDVLDSLGDGSHLTSSDAAMMMDFDVAMQDPHASSVEALARQYNAIMVLEE